LLQTLADVLQPGGEIVLETYGSRLGASTPAIEVREPGDVYVRHTFTYHIHKTSWPPALRPWTAARTFRGERYRRSRRAASGLPRASLR
jgi:hypothetical protein